MTDNDDRTPADQLADLLVYTHRPLLRGPDAAAGACGAGSRPHHATPGSSVSSQCAGARPRCGAASQGSSRPPGYYQALGVLPVTSTDRGGDGAGQAGARSTALRCRPDRSPAARVEPAEPGPDVADLAMPDYDSLSASHVVTRLPGLTLDELEAVRGWCCRAAADDPQQDRPATTVTTAPERASGTAPELTARPPRRTSPRVATLAGAATAEKLGQKGGALWAPRGPPGAAEATLRSALDRQTTRWPWGRSTGWWWATAWCRPRRFWTAGCWA